MRRWIAAILLVIMAAIACAGPQPFRSPLIVPEPVYRLYMPVVPQARVKRGLGLTYQHCEDAMAIGARWIYNWSSDPPDCGRGIESVPMVWGRWLPETVGGNSGWVMGQNEPDLPGQANLTPDEAAVLWRQMEARWPERRLVAPAPSHLYPGWLIAWRRAYIARYGHAPRVDALAAHCYLMSADGCIELVRWFADRARDWGISGGVWVTEFAFLPCTDPQMQAEVERFVGWMERSQDVARWAPFAARVRGGEAWWPDVSAKYNPGLLGFEDGRLTKCGELYAR